MDVGIQMNFSGSGWEGISDSTVFDEEIRLALLAEELGFDVLWAAEHHFFDYSFCPDNVEVLAYLAGRTSRIDLGTAAVIMPWNDPLRVAEKIALLDTLSEGRVRFGMGRGLSRREFELFAGVEMDESRGRFDEAAAMVVEALRTGHIEGNGQYYPQPRAEIRPRPERSFADRLYAVASSDDSADAAARLAARMVMFADRSWEHRMPTVDRYRTAYKDVNGVEAPPPLICDFCTCLPDADEIELLAPQTFANYLSTVLHHYEVMGTHFEETEGYAAYASAAETLRRMGESGFLKSFMGAGAWGTPDEVLSTLEARRELIGPFELSTSFRFGGMPFDKAEQSMRLFATEVLPVLKAWDRVPASA
jgi:alkanesulfonate monooxygenase SsuD/methylene tetrahydromethanopterin reductase-like flavin-dependent oxidoreductase (luciferase family)